MSKKYGRKETREPARRVRVTFKARTPEGEKRKITFLIRRKR